VARDGRAAAYRHDTYWARPVPGWGDPAARIVLVGLAPAAHGANRTGRLFTGDVPGGSSDFLMRALHACGLASLPASRSIDDGLTLTDVWISAAVRCAPPDNAPVPSEVQRCLGFLERELEALPRTRVVVALGRLAFDVLRRVLPPAGAPQRRRPAFEHEGVYRTADGRAVVASYHPSRQNTQTGRLTQAMLRRAIRRAKALAG
jgi:uracil-DNA glycosylase family 4